MELVKAAPFRAALVTASLAGAGFVCGAVAGALAMTIGGAFTLGLAGVTSMAQPSFLAAIAGGCLGAVAAPVLGYLFLRRVPIGVAFLWCSIGTTVGGVGGWLALSREDTIAVPIFGAAAGLLAATIWLWYRYRADGITGGAT